MSCTWFSIKTPMPWLHAWKGHQGPTGVVQSVCAGMNYQAGCPVTSCLTRRIPVPLNPMAKKPGMTVASGHTTQPVTNRLRSTSLRHLNDSHGQRTRPRTRPRTRTRSTHPLLANSSAICTAFKAAPFLILSDTIHKFNPFSILKSLRILPT